MYMNKNVEDALAVVSAVDIGYSEDEMNALLDDLDVDSDSALSALAAIFLGILDQMECSWDDVRTSLGRAIAEGGV